MTQIKEQPMDTTEFDETGQISIVRTNMMNDRSYAPYCGSVFPGHPNYKTCSSPRVRWVNELSQFRCPHCGWVSEFPKEFISRYKQKHSIS